MYIRLMKDTACSQEKGREPDAEDNAGRSAVALQGHGTADDAEGAEGEEVEPPQDSIGPVADKDEDNWNNEDDIDGRLGR